MQVLSCIKVFLVIIMGICKLFFIYGEYDKEMVSNYRKKDFRVMFDLTLSLHSITHSLIFPLHYLQCGTLVI